jgi:nucleotide-binding universal stress UspA family protein
MYESLLVPLDGSTWSEQSLPQALSLARRTGATLQIAHVHVPVWGVHGERGGIYDSEVDCAVRERDLAYLEGIIRRLEAASDVSLSSALLDGSIADAISRQAAATHVDLVIMTTHGRGPLVRFWLGSVADALVRQMSIPILFVRPRETSVDVTQDSDFQRVLIPLDGSKLAEQVLEPALGIAAAMQAEVALLRVVEPVVPIDQGSDGTRASGLGRSIVQRVHELHEQNLTEAREYLGQLAQGLSARSVPVQTRVVLKERPGSAILEDASAYGADLIALATQGRGGLKRLLLGSVADKVLRGSSTSVLVYRPVVELDSLPQS